MKYFLALLLLSIVTLSCSSDDANETQNPIIGSWTLASTTTSDGSSILNTSYEENEMVYTFMEDGTMTSSKSLCIFGPVGNPSSGTYNTENQTISTDCGGSITTKTYELLENDLKLVFNGGCIETCVEVFVRLD